MISGGRGRIREAPGLDVHPNILGGTSRGSVIRQGLQGGGGGAITGVVSTEPRPGIVVVGTEPRRACVIALTTESRFAAKSAAAERRAALRVSMLSEVIVAIAS